MATKLQQELLQMHISHELDLLSPEKIKSTLHVETTQFVNLYYSKKLKDVYTPQKFQAYIQKNISKLNLSEGLLKFIKKGILINKSIMNLEKETIGIFVDKDSFFQFSKQAVGLKEARNKFIHFAVNSSAYSRMISNIIFAAIKDFLVTQNPLAKNNPLGGAFLKMGSDFLNNLPGMQGNFESKITEFIRQNLSGRIQQSESLIQSELDSGKTSDILDEFWEFFSKISLQEGSTYLTIEQIDAFLETFPGFWDHLKKSGIVERMLIENMNSFYKEYSEKEFSYLLTELGITKEILAEELTELLTISLDNEEFRNYYKIVLTRRLENFYFSESVEKLLKD